jgi:hypothetical protein
MTSPTALHSNEHAEHYTPTAIASLAHKVMGRISLDPFSCDRANEVIRADMIYTVEDDGFEAPWGDTADPQSVFCNPPSGRVKRKPARADKARVKPGQAHAWWKLIDEWEAGLVLHAVFLSFNMNLFQTAQRFGYPAPFEFPFCVPGKRLKFWGVDRAEGKGSPSHASAVVYLPPKERILVHPCTGDMRSVPDCKDIFAEIAAPLGRVVVPA